MYMYVCVCDIGEGVVGESGIVFICWCSPRDVVCVVCAAVEGAHCVWGEVTDLDWMLCLI